MPPACINIGKSPTARFCGIVDEGGKVDANITELLVDNVESGDHVNPYRNPSAPNAHKERKVCRQQKKPEQAAKDQAP